MRRPGEINKNDLDFESWIQGYLHAIHDGTKSEKKKVSPDAYRAIQKLVESRPYLKNDNPKAKEVLGYSIASILAKGRKDYHRLLDVYDSYAGVSISRKRLYGTHELPVYEPKHSASRGWALVLTLVTCIGVGVGGAYLSELKPSPTKESLCNNKLDDDADGQIDCEDEDCKKDKTCTAASQHETQCVDRLDNDSDGKTDCEDADCKAHKACIVSPEPGLARETQCVDRLDDDLDSLVDCDDPDCEHDKACQTRYRCEDELAATTIKIPVGDGPARGPTNIEKLFILLSFVSFFFSVYFVYRRRARPPKALREARLKEQQQEDNKTKQKARENELAMPLRTVDEYSKLKPPAQALAESSWYLCLLAEELQSGLIDGPATVYATIQSGGQFTPVLEKRRFKKPLTVFVDIESGDYVWLGRFKRWLHDWQKQGVFLDIYYFDAYPERLTRVVDKKVLSFADITKISSGPLLIFSRSIHVQSREDLGLDKYLDAPNFEPENEQKREQEARLALWLDLLPTFSACAWIDPEPGLSGRVKSNEILESAGLRRYPFTEDGIVAAAAYLSKPEEFKGPVAWPGLPSLQDEQVQKSLDLWTKAVSAVPDPSWDLVERIRRLEPIQEGLDRPEYVRLLLNRLAKEDRPLTGLGQGPILEVAFATERVAELRKEYPEFEKDVRRLILDDLKQESPQTMWDKANHRLREARHELLIEPTKEKIENFQEFLQDALVRDKAAEELKTILTFFEESKISDEKQLVKEGGQVTTEIETPLSIFGLRALLPQSAWGWILTPILLLISSIFLWNIWSIYPQANAAIFDKTSIVKNVLNAATCSIEKQKAADRTIAAPKPPTNNMVRITFNVDVAQVKLGDRMYEGSSPAVFNNVKRGEYSLEVSALCKRTYTGNVVVTNKEVTRHVSLSNRPRGPIAFNIQSEPIGAQLRINGRKVRKQTPTDVNLRCQKNYKLNVSLDGYVSQDLSITPDEKNSSLFVTLQKQVASCTDGKQNQDETGVDCGGPCKACDSVEMKRIAAGVFLMGCVPGDGFCYDDEKPQHRVRLNSFRMDTTEVTIKAYRRCVDAGKCKAPEEGKDSSGECNWNRRGRDNHPVNCVTWKQAQTYCKYVGKKLPTEAQWERAARAQDGDIYAWGSEEPSKSRAVYSNNFGELKKTEAVASKQLGAFGLYDMAGNVYEWVEDCYKEDIYKSRKDVVTNPLNNPEVCPSGRRVLRGGSFFTGSGLRSSFRSGFDPDFRRSDVGFRCVSAF